MMSKKVATKPKLSFDMEEEDEGEEGGGFQVKKSKESRKFKKMRQAPGVADVIAVESTVSTTVERELGGSYSAASLAQLREAQLFGAPQAATPKVHSEPKDEYESMELSGEAAEEFVEKVELMAMKERNAANLGDFVGFDATADLATIHAARVVNKSILKGKSEERVYTSHLLQPDKKVSFDLAQDNDPEWEEEIIKRGVINSHTALAEENKDIAGVVNQTSRSSATNNSIKASFTSRQSSSTVPSSVLGEISVADILKSVQLAVDKLTFNREAAERKIEQNRQEIDQAQTEDKELREKVEIGVKRLNIIQDIKYFFASLVGMLREKRPHIDELRDVLVTVAKERRELLQRRRVDEQEDILYRLKEASLMVSMGNYVPTGILAAPAVPAADSISSTAAPELDAFGRVKAPASSSAAADPRVTAAALKRREDQRLRDRVRLVESLSGLSEADTALILANRLCDTSQEKQRCWRGTVSGSDVVNLYALVVQQSALYNAKGEEVNLSIKLSTVTQATQAVVEDVQPELLNVGTILARLSEFRQAYPTEYQAAFIGESAAELLQPLIALDLVAMHTQLLREDAQQAVSFKNREWFAPLREFVEHSPNGEVEGQEERRSAPKNSMASIAAQINNLFEEDEHADEAKETLMSKVADLVLLPWLRDNLLPALDPASSGGCAAVVALVQELKDLCSPRIGKTITTSVCSTIERLFESQTASVCLPLLKLGAPRGVEEQKSPENASSVSESVEFARAYAVHQLQRLLLLLQNMLLFRQQKLVRVEVAAACAWRCLGENALPSVMKLMKAGTLEDKVLVLDLCCIVLANITGTLRSYRGFATGSRSMMYDGQLTAWKVSPAQFRQVQAAVEMLIAALRGMESPQRNADGALFAELNQALSACS